MTQNRPVTFTVDHINLEPGIYESRVDEIGGTRIVTYDIRLCRPYKDKTLTPGEAHTVEHIFASAVRSAENENIKVVYFGPMGCLTGFDLILAGNFTETEAVGFIRRAAENALRLKTTPGNKKEECGNCFSLLKPGEVKTYLEKILRLIKASESSGRLPAYPLLKEP